MKATATFNIEGSFKITGRGLVIYGDILDGRIRYENFIAFNIETKQMKLKIKGIDFIDSIKDNVSKVALTFYYENDNQRDNLQTLQVAKQTVTIFEDNID